MLPFASGLASTIDVLARRETAWILRDDLPERGHTLRREEYQYALPALAVAKSDYRIILSATGCFNFWCVRSDRICRVEMTQGAAVVSMSTLGKNGRLGNQIFQYAFLRLYAKRHGLLWEAPPWIGQLLFGHRDPPISSPHRPVFVDERGSERLLTTFAAPIVNVDLWGYFQYHTRWFAEDRSDFIELFRPVERFAAAAREAVARLRRRGTTVVALHLRRGDFAPGTDFIAPADCYLDWLEDNWEDWEEPVLYIASDDVKAVAPRFERFAPVVWEDLNITMPEFADYGDFSILTHADALAISNSSFSYAASLLNERARVFARPLPARAALSRFEPWNDRPIVTREDAFQHETLRRTAAAVTSWRNGERDAVGEIRLVRRLIADTWLGADDYALAVLYSSEFGDAHRLLATVETRAIPLDGNDENYVHDLKAKLAGGLGEPWATQYLLAAMLFCPAAELPMRHDLQCVPGWLLAAYVCYLERR